MKPRRRRGGASVVGTHRVHRAIIHIAYSPSSFINSTRRKSPLHLAGIHITDIEAAINYWRTREPSPDGVALPAPTRALAEVYALMVYYHEAEADEFSMPPKALAAWMQWYAATPDTPCIAICSTSQGDEQCKGCGRTFDEVQRWPEMRPAEKRVTWHRITSDGSAWRFNKYAERAAERVRNPTDGGDVNNEALYK